MLDELNPAASERYLGALLLTVTARHLRDEALRMVGPDDFASPPISALWAGARRLADAGQPIDRRRLVAAAIDADPLPPVRGRNGRGGWEQTLRGVLASLADTMPNPKEFPHVVAEVTRCGGMRRLVETAERIKQYAAIAEDPSEAYVRAADDIAQLAKGDVSSEVRSYADLLDEFERDMLTPDTTKTIPTPWPEVNEVLQGGLRGGKFYVIGARPGEGKSLAAGNIAEYAASLGHPALVFSVEMPDLEVTGRMVSAGATVNLGEIARRDLSATSWQFVHEYTGRARKYPLWISDRADLSLGKIKAIARQQKRATGLDVLVVDYLQLVKPYSAVPRHEQIGEISRGLKVLSRELECAVIAPSQLNRRTVDRDRPALADLRESGNIEQDSDVVILQQRQVYTQDDVTSGEAAADMVGEPNGLVTVDIAKHRGGPTKTLTLNFRGHYARIE